MTNSDSKDRPGKRERLVASAGDLLHRRGVQRTTLAEIAKAADVPPGNVYYYFKTRDDLVRAVIDARVEVVRSQLATFERGAGPEERLKRLAGSWAEAAEIAAAHGCPIGSLCSELNKLDEGLAGDAAQVIRVILDWTETQFREMGHDKDARELATTLLIGVQGAALLADTLRDPEILLHEVRRLGRWIDSLT